jgi:rubrerythrin
MPRPYQRYDRDTLAAVVKTSSSFAEVSRRLGKRPAGGTLTNIKLMCRRWEIDASHMTGQAHRRGQQSHNRKDASSILTMGTDMDHRKGADRLRRALLEIGVPYKCNACGISDWLGRPLVLEVDHIDSRYWNNTAENLQFLCPNCHTLKTKDDA